MGVCPAELAAYQEVLLGLFSSAPIVQIQAGEDIITEPESQNPVPPTDSTQEIIEVPATVEEDEAVVTKDEADVSHQALARSLHKQPAKPLQWLATKRGIDTSNLKRHQIASALVGQVTQAELQEAIAQTTTAG